MGWSRVVVIIQGVVWGRSPCQADRWVPTRSPAPGAQRPAGTGAAEPGPCPLTAPSAPRPPGAPGTCPSLLHGHHRHHARLPHPRRPAHPWVQHPAAPSMLSDVQWTALPALLPPAPGECRDNLGTAGALGAQTHRINAGGAGAAPGPGEGAEVCARAGFEPRFSPRPAADPGMRHATAPRLLPDVPPPHLQRPLHPAPAPAASAPPPAAPHGAPGAVRTSPSPAPAHGESGQGLGGGPETGAAVGSPPCTPRGCELGGMKFDG